MARDKNGGFTLIEVIIAMGILSVGIIAMYSMQVTGIQGNATASRITTEATWAADQVEKMVAMAYLDTPLSDTDSDGTNKDNNLDGIDDSGKNFGLDDVGTEADGSDVTSDGLYTVFWNVAEDVPIKNSKQISIIVQSTKDSKIVRLLYMKSNPL
jgi:prepilin-type N-terminal cleavage/methylation domain-containing protein